MVKEYLVLAVDNMAPKSDIGKCQVLRLGLFSLARLELSEQKAKPWLRNSGFAVHWKHASAGLVNATIRALSEQAKQNHQQVSLVHAALRLIPLRTSGSDGPMAWVFSNKQDKKEDSLAERVWIIIALVLQYSSTILLLSYTRLRTVHAPAVYQSADLGHLADPVSFYGSNLRIQHCNVGGDC
ncbi:hypothetical protein VTL71DRAFT_8115 [Oculimacula yallundae]|uniref:Uncharacterized protein n=1 Tax=Oculimacula yallundae TaxID=86028 RepID=A0ABR4CWX7_9HELO